MQLSLTWSSTGHRLTATLQGPVSYAHRRIALDRVLDSAAERGVTQLMVDFTLAWHLVAAPEEKAAFFTALRARPALAGARIAYVNCPEGDITELQAVADEMGFVARTFLGRSEAIAWLGSARGAAAVVAAQHRGDRASARLSKARAS